MKRATLLMAALTLSACGAPGSTGSNSPEKVADSPSDAVSTPPSAPSDAVSTPPSEETIQADAALTTPNCSPLQAVGVSANGDDGDVPGNVLDDRLDTRWSRLGKGSAIDLDLGSTRSVSGASIAWHLGDQRTNAFTLSVSSDGANFSQVYSGQSAQTAAAQTYAFSAQNARYLRITVNGNSLNEWASIAEARACGPSSSTGGGTGASIVWRGDFETGDRSQWSGTEMVSADRLQVVPSPARQGHYALKATVRQGDNPINASGNRNELLRMTHEAVGSEYYYKWSTMFAPDFPSVNTWQLFTQWHHDGANGSPPLEFYVRGERIYLRLQGRDDMVVWNTPLVRGQWLDFILHVKWSPDSSVGFVELYYNGQLALPKKSVATMFAGNLNYLKIGLYRDAAVGPVGVVYHDGWTMARSLADVLSPTATSTPLTAATTE